eukprot:TRINITY_DN1296_c0_g1_i14.p1 TRINITY_DN1296_c0_g1~~TRINITY_DN1296_c0_g1_i14.p1  ORF type:complete len:151 (-),score=23.80 TRINITY_DN1296_c0_g1_i14:1034-1486(-)
MSFSQEKEYGTSFKESLFVSCLYGSYFSHHITQFSASLRLLQTNLTSLFPHLSLFPIIYDFLLMVLGLSHWCLDTSFQFSMLLQISLHSTNPNSKKLTGSLYVAVLPLNTIPPIDIFVLVALNGWTLSLNFAISWKDWNTNFIHFFSAFG